MTGFIRSEHDVDTHRRMNAFRELLYRRLYVRSQWRWISDAPNYAHPINAICR